MDPRQNISSSNKALLSRRVLSFLYIISCVIGFLYQVLTVSSVYFEYKTTSRLRYLITEPLTPPNLALCFRYTDIFDWKTWSVDKNFTNPDGRIGRSHLFWDVTRSQSRVSLQDIFKYTPPTRYIVKFMLYRSPDSFLMKIGDRHNVSTLMTISKYYTQEFMCYRMLIKDHNHRTISITHLSTSLYYGPLFYDLILSSALNGVDYFKAIVFHGGFPLISKYFSPITDRLTDFKKRSVKHNIFTFGYHLRRVDLLPSPYDTHCSPSITDTNSCMLMCLVGKLKESINRVPFSVSIREDEFRDLLKEDPKISSIRHVDFFDLMNSTRDRFIVNSHEQCRQSCLTYPCSFVYTITTTSMVTRVRNSYDFRVRVRAPQAPPIMATTTAKLTLAEYVLYISSCLGIWFGVSVLKCNPIKFLSQRKKRCKVEHLTQC